jgi:hypothetical protein
MDFKKGDWVVFKKKYKYGDAVVGNISNRVMIVIRNSYMVHNVQVVDVIVRSNEPHYTISTTYLKKLEKD